MILMTLDSVFLSEFHLAEKVQGEVGEFKSSRLVLLIINFQMRPSWWSKASKNLCQA